MSTMVAELTVDELKYIIQEAMALKLSEMLGVQMKDWNYVRKSRPDSDAP